MTRSTDPYFTQILPEDISEDTVIRVGYVEAPVRLLVSSGFVKEINGRFYRHPAPFPQPRPPRPPAPDFQADPFSIPELHKRGYEVVLGKSPEETKVNLGLNTYMRLPLAIGLGLITPTSTPTNQ